MSDALKSDSSSRPNLVLQTAFTGDFLLSIPLLRNLREKHPESPLWMVGRSAFGDFALKLGLVDKYFPVEKGLASKGWSEARSQCSQVEFATIYCPHRSPRSAFFVYRMKAGRKIGFHSSWNSFAFTHRLRYPVRLPDALRQLSLLGFEDEKLASLIREYERAHAPGGLPLSLELAKYSVDNYQSDADPTIRRTRQSLKLPPPPSWASMQIPQLRSLDFTSELKSVLSKIELNFDQQILFIAPGSVWPTKRWTEKGFAELAHRYMNRGWQVVLIGTKQDLSASESIGRDLINIKSTVGELSLLSTAQLLAHGNLLLSNDSGAAHIASLSDLPTVSIFGPTVPDQGYRPWTSKATVAQIDLECRPCGAHGSKKCPLGTHACMQSLTAEMVDSSIESMMQPRVPVGLSFQDP